MGWRPTIVHLRVRTHEPQSVSLNNFQKNSCVCKKTLLIGILWYRSDNELHPTDLDSAKRQRDTHAARAKIPKLQATIINNGTLIKVTNFPTDPIRPSKTRNFYVRCEPCTTVAYACSVHWTVICHAVVYSTIH